MVGRGIVNPTSSGLGYVWNSNPDVFQIREGVTSEGGPFCNRYA